MNLMTSSYTSLEDKSFPLQTQADAFEKSGQICFPIISFTVQVESVAPQT